MLKTISVSTIAACVLVSTAAAQQGGWLIETTNIVSPAQPTTSVEVWAWFDDPTGERNAFGRGDYDFLAADGEFSNPQMYIGAAGFSAGTPMGSGVTGVFVGQWWGFAGVNANMQNPILVWSADWTTADFTPRTVSLDTRNTTTFQIGTNSTHSTMNLLELYPQGFTPGTGAIEVVPSPASTTPLLVLGAAMLRRRRRAV